MFDIVNLSSDFSGQKVIIGLKTEARILDRGTDYYFTVDVYNENGVGQGSNIQFAPSLQPGVGVRMIKAKPGTD